MRAEPENVSPVLGPANPIRWVYVVSQKYLRNKATPPSVQVPRSLFMISNGRLDWTYQASG
jgi:hypothetical protein